MKLIQRIPRVYVTLYLLYLAVAVLITWPLLTVFSTHFPGFRDSDAHEMTRHIWWFKYALQHAQPLIFQPLLAYPDGLQGVILWSDPLQFFPAWLFAFFLPLPAAYNLQVLLTLALNGWAAYWLITKLTRPHDEKPPKTLSWQTHFPAFLAGLIFMTAPTIQGHLTGGHGGLLVQWPLPFLAYGLLHLNRSLRSLTLTALLIFLVPLGHTLQLIYAVMPLLVLVTIRLLYRRDWQTLARLVAVTLIAAVLLALFLLPVFRDTVVTTAYTEERGGVRYSADLLSLLTPSFQHIFYGQWDFTHRVLGVNIVEGFSYLGILPTLLGILALWKVRPARWWLGLAFLAWLLSLGPLLKLFNTPLTVLIDNRETHLTLPWALLYNLPGFSLARTPGRFNLVLALAVAVLAGYGAAWLWERLAALRQQWVWPPRLITLFLVAFIIFDYQAFWPLPTYSAEIPQAVYDLARRDDVRAVFDLPWDNVLAAKDALWLQTAHEKPMIAGQVTRRTPVSPAKLTLLQITLDPALLNQAGVDILIIHKAYDTALANRAREQFGEPFYEDPQIALFDLRPR